MFKATSPVDPSLSKEAATVGDILLSFGTDLPPSIVRFTCVGCGANMEIGPDVPDSGYSESAAYAKKWNAQHVSH